MASYLAIFESCLISYIGCTFLFQKKQFLSSTSHLFAVDDGCREFSQGMCGWVNSNQKGSPWRQTLKQEMERSTIQVNSYLQRKGLNPASG